MVKFTFERRARFKALFYYAGRHLSLVASQNTVVIMVLGALRNFINKA